MYELPWDRAVPDSSGLFRQDTATLLRNWGMVWGTWRAVVLASKFPNPTEHLWDVLDQQIWFMEAPSWTLKDFKDLLLMHWSQTQFLEGHSSAQFSPNPNQTHLIQLIKVFRITRNFQTGVIWSWLELNCAELWPSRNWVWDQCANVFLPDTTGHV